MKYRSLFFRELREILTLERVQSNIGEDTRVLLCGSGFVFVVAVLNALRNMYMDSFFLVMSLPEAVFYNIKNIYIWVFVLTPIMLYLGKKDTGMERMYLFILIRTKMRLLCFSGLISQLKRSFCLSASYLIGSVVTLSALCIPNGHAGWQKVSTSAWTDYTEHASPIGACLWQFICLFLFLFIIGLLMFSLLKTTRNIFFAIAVPMGLTIISYLRYSPMLSFPTFLLGYLVEFSLHVWETLIFSFVTCSVIIVTLLHRCIYEDSGLRVGKDN